MNEAGEGLTGGAEGLAALVYDVGGSHVAASVCRGSDLRLGAVCHAPHPAEKSSQAFIDYLHALGAKAADGVEGLAGATLAVPSPFDFAAGISRMRHKLPFLYGVNLRLALAGRFGWQPEQVSFLNDADAYLLGEIGAGAARGFSRAVGITLGTGAGSAFAVNGRLTGAGEGVPKDGEIWNLPYEGGMVEDFLSSRAITGNYRRRTGETRDVASLAAAAETDPAAAACFAEFGKHLGRVIGGMLAGFAPQVVVVGGGISRAARLFLPAAAGELKGSAIQLRVSELQERAALVGCAAARFRSGVD